MLITHNFVCINNISFRHPAPVGYSQARHQHSSPVAARLPQPGGSGTVATGGHQQQSLDEPRYQYYYFKGIVPRSVFNELGNIE